MAVTGKNIGEGGDYSGTYTPITVALSNCTVPVYYESHWIRVGDIVTVSGMIAVLPSTVALVSASFSLPIPSVFTLVSQCTGAGGNSSSNSSSVRMQADTTNNCAKIDFTPLTTTTFYNSFSFTYRIL